MFKYYKYNMKTIDFWLSSLVLPMETMQFPRRLVSNSWNLADNAQKNVIGFSGTNDNKLLLPLQVTQSTPLIPQLEAANGKMLALFMRKSALTCLEIDQYSSLSDTVLSTAVNTPRCAALIDAGALMAGLSNQQVAEKLSALLTEKKSALKGVVFFDDGKNAWSFRIHTGYIWLLENSPVQEKDAFVYFDESRCRGADMKLSRYAVAALTIGPGMCKDKLMQAAFRMRQLDREQSLNLMLPMEVATRVQQFASKEFDNIIPKDVMRWVLKNTVKEITSGLPGWASQGSYYSTTKRNPKLRLLDENLKLTDLYAFPCTDAAVYDVNMQTQKRFLERCPKDAHILHEFMSEIESRSKKFGRDIFAKEVILDEECERELEIERELEQEVQLQVPHAKPIMEQKWDYSKIFSAESPLTLPSYAGIVSLRTAICSMSPDFEHINWDKNIDIYVTDNFLKSVGNSMSPMLEERQQFLRLVDAAIYFDKSSKLLLLSEYEADSILLLQWERQLLNQSCPNYFVNWSFFKNSSHVSKCLSSSAIASVQLFSGETMFAPEEEKTLIAELLTTPKGREVALHFTVFRETQHHLARSVLEKVSDSDLKD